MIIKLATSFEKQEDLNKIYKNGLALPRRMSIMESMSWDWTWMVQESERISLFKTSLKEADQGSGYSAHDRPQYKSNLKK